LLRSAYHPADPTPFHAPNDKAHGCADLEHAHCAAHLPSYANAFNPHSYCRIPSALEIADGRQHPGAYPPADDSALTAPYNEIPDNIGSYAFAIRPTHAESQREKAQAFCCSNHPPYTRPHDYSNVRPHAGAHRRPHA